MIGACFSSVCVVNKAMVCCPCNGTAGDRLNLANRCEPFQRLSEPHLGQELLQAILVTDLT